MSASLLFGQRISSFELLSIAGWSRGDCSATPTGGPSGKTPIQRQDLDVVPATLPALC